MKIKALVETYQTFTLEQLKALQETGADLPITANFDNKTPLGMVDKIELVEDKFLVVYGTITKELDFDLEYFFLTIGYILDSHKMIVYGFTDNPINKGLAKIEILE